MKRRFQLNVIKIAQQKALKQKQIQNLTIKTHLKHHKNRSQGQQLKKKALGYASHLHLRQLTLTNNPRPNLAQTLLVKKIRNYSRMTLITPVFDSSVFHHTAKPDT